MLEVQNLLVSIFKLIYYLWIKFYCIYYSNFEIFECILKIELYRKPYQSNVEKVSTVIGFVCPFVHWILRHPGLSICVLWLYDTYPYSADGRALGIRNVFCRSQITWLDHFSYVFRNQVLVFHSPISNSSQVQDSGLNYPTEFIHRLSSTYWLYSLQKIKDNKIFHA